MKPLVYIVEDDADIARLVRHHLEEADFATSCFSQITGVFTEAVKVPPALFLLDIMVPGGNGLELCLQIRQSRLLVAVPVIFAYCEGFGS